MKTIRLLMAAALIAGTTVASCGKYSEGPAFSLRTKAKRLSRTWDLKQIIHPDGSTTDDTSDDVITFDKHGTYSGTQNSNAIGGKWSFGEDAIGRKDKTKLVTAQSGSSTGPVTVTIIRLTSKELWTQEVSGAIYKSEVVK